MVWFILATYFYETFADDPFNMDGKRVFRKRIFNYQPEVCLSDSSYM